MPSPHVACHLLVWGIEGAGLRVRDVEMAKLPGEVQGGKEKVTGELWGEGRRRLQESGSRKKHLHFIPRWI